MKKNPLLFLLLLSQTDFAQVWCTPGSVWHYKAGGYMGTGYRRLDYLYDTIIAGKACNKIRDLAFNENYNGVKTIINYFYTHTDNNVVYLLNGGSFDTLYDFNAAIGDKWRIPPVNSPDCNGSYVTVVAKGASYMDGQYITWFQLSRTNKTANTFGNFSGYVYERLGAVNMYPYDPRNVCATHSHFPWDGPMRCFSDNQITYKHNYSGPCDYMYVSLNELQAGGNTFFLYPNPLSSDLNLDLQLPPDETEIYLRISDLSGRQVKQLHLEPGKTEYRFQLNDLGSGVYLVSLVQKQQIISTTKLIKQEQ